MRFSYIYLPQRGTHIFVDIKIYFLGITTYPHLTQVYQWIKPRTSLGTNVSVIESQVISHQWFVAQIYLTHVYLNNSPTKPKIPFILESPAKHENSHPRYLCEMQEPCLYNNKVGRPKLRNILCNRALKDTLYSIYNKETTAAYIHELHSILNHSY